MSMKAAVIVIWKCSLYLSPIRGSLTSLRDKRCGWFPALWSCFFLSRVLTASHYSTKAAVMKWCNMRLLQETQCVDKQTKIASGLSENQKCVCGPSCHSLFYMQYDAVSSIYLTKVSLKLTANIIKLWRMLQKRKWKVILWIYSVTILRC